MLCSEILFALCHYESTSGHISLTPSHLKTASVAEWTCFLTSSYPFLLTDRNLLFQGSDNVPPLNDTKYLLQTSTYTDKRALLGLETFVSAPQWLQPTVRDQKAQRCSTLKKWRYDLPTSKRAKIAREVVNRTEEEQFFSLPTPFHCTELCIYSSKLFLLETQSRTQCHRGTFTTVPVSV